MLKKFTYIFFKSDYEKISSKRDFRLWVFYSTLKNALESTHTVRKTGLKKFCEDNLPYSYETCRKYLKEIVSEGYAKEVELGYSLVAINKAAVMKFGVVNPKARFTIVGQSITEVKGRVSFCLMTKNQEQQGFVEGVKILQDPNKKLSDIPKQIVRSKTKSLKDTKRNRVKGNIYKIKSISVRWVSNSLGYSSPTTGSRLQKIWESLGLAKIERRSQVLCRAINIDKMNRYAKDCGYDLNNRYFITKDGYARERLINFIFINQENMEEIERRTEYKLKLMHG